MVASGGNASVSAFEATVSNIVHPVTYWPLEKSVLALATALTTGMPVALYQRMTLAAVGVITADAVAGTIPMATATMPRAAAIRRASRGR
jgi:hypothetical protein